MNKGPIVVETEINAPASIIWKALSDKVEMKEWYFDLAQFEPEPGFEFQFTGGTEDRQYLHLCKVTEVIPEKKLTHTWTYENVPTVTYVTWELSPAADNKTTVKLTHDGVDDFPADNKDFAKNNFVEGWTHIVKTSLKEYAEKQSS